MIRGRRRALAGASVAVALAVVIGWWMGRPTAADRPRRPTPPGGAPRLDVARFRDHVARHRATARAVAARFGRDAGATRSSVSADLVRRMVEPRCILGPGELCAILSDAVTACATDDARACLAVGQYLEDTPPRPMAAIFYYRHGCRLGDPEACARMDEPKSSESIDCDRDLMRCAFQARGARDLVQLAQACERGVADTCAVLSEEYADQPAVARAYLTQSCQLGNPMACQELGLRLAPDCTGTCYAPDPEQAAAAQILACEAGFEEACARLPP